MKFISLFSGIGGLDLGLEWAGWECIAQVEKDEYCRRVLAKHWPGVPRFEDVRNVGKQNLPSADAIVGGFPCQPHSYAGKRKGAADDRNLWPDYLRIVTELRPAWVVGENVPGLRTSMLDDIISDLEGADYAVQTFDIPAVAFDARHIRHRLFIVAHANGAGSQALASQRGEHHGKGASGSLSSRGWAVADSNGAGQCERRGAEPVPQEQLAAQRGGEGLGHAEGKPVWAGLREGEQAGQWGRRPGDPSRAGEFWATEPDVGRVAHGVSRRVDRLRGLGNAVVPQVAEFVGRMILESGMDIETKRCVRCGIEKPISEFYKRRRYAGGRSDKCKECIDILRRQWDRRKKR